MESNDYENKNEPYQKVSINDNENESFSEMTKLKLQKEDIDNEYEVEKSKNYVKMTIIIIIVFIFMLYILFFRNKILGNEHLINIIDIKNIINYTKNNDIYNKKSSNFVNEMDNNVEIKNKYLSNNNKENESNFEIKNNSLNDINEVFNQNKESKKNNYYNLTGNENEMVGNNISTNLNKMKEKSNNDSSNSQKENNQKDNQEIYKVYKNIYIKTENQYLEFCKGRKLIAQIHIYFKLCEKGILFDKKVYEEVMKPKISIIIPVRNREEFILRALRSIQNQPMKDIEIIFIDDASTDKSVTLIEEYQKTDKRIILIKHEENQGTLKTRIEGIYKARGEYIQFVDSDDVLHYNILNIAYEEAQKGDYEIIQFKVARKKLTDERYSYYSYDRNTTPIYQPKLSSLMYYYNGTLFQTDFHVWDKLIKKEALIRALKSIKQYYLKQHMSINEDGVLDFMLLKTAKSYKFIKNYGYIYVANPSGAIFSLKKTKNKTIRDYILYLRYLFEHTDNNEYEKSMAGEQLKYVFKKFYNYLDYVTSNFDFIFDTLNLYLNCPYISDLNKRRIKKMIDKLKKAQDKVKQKNYKDDIKLENIKI